MEQRAEKEQLVLETTFSQFFERNPELALHPIIVGVSGGADSMALLSLCIYKGLSIVAGHVNYGLRGKDSDADQGLVESFCSMHSISCTTMYAGPKPEGNLQAWARGIRYSFFEKLAQTHLAKSIFVAHHGDDVTETVLIRFLQGKGPHAFSKPIQEVNGIVYRPILTATKAHILQYLAERAIPWREDASNNSLVYMRNYVRNQLIPEFDKTDIRWRTSVKLLLNQAIRAETGIVPSEYEGIHYYPNSDNTIEGSSNPLLLEISVLKTSSDIQSFFQLLFLPNLRHHTAERLAALVFASNGSQVGTRAWLAVHKDGQIHISPVRKPLTK
jgi:tRNA(Ile)-lysidine synthetase-like protein